MHDISRLMRFGIVSLAAAGMCAIGAAQAATVATPFAAKDTAVQLAQAAQPKGQPKAAMARQPDQRVMAAQRALAQRGQNPGPIDGLMGPKTQQAIRMFQAQRGMAQTGALDAATLNALGVQ